MSPDPTPCDTPVTPGEAVGTACHFCGHPDRFTINGPHWTGGAYARIDYCGKCAYRIVRAPRTTRRRREVTATDWNMLVAFTRNS